jgi:hypothetical protein
MSTATLRDLAPGIARDLAGPEEPERQFRPSFINWALDEIERLHTRITPDTPRQERFEVQNRIATIRGTAHVYGQWLYANARLNPLGHSGVCSQAVEDASDLAGDARPVPVSG